MNREIKFRVWDKENKLMFPHTLIDQYDKDGFMLWGDIFSGQDKTVELMQFTGLKDKNGKEIYEGDIVKCIDHPTGFESCVGFVHCNNARWRVTWSAMSLDEYGSQWIEVIGNIYENPELLEK